jgi:hypothetical protein
MAAARHNVQSMDRDTLYIRLWLIWLALLIGGVVFVLMH